MKKSILKISAVLMVFSLAGCAGSGPKTLSNEYVTVENYQGVEIEKVKASEVTEEDIDKVVNHMMEGYVAQHDLPADTPITDEIVKETMSDTAETVEQYRNELKKQIEETKEEAAREEEEIRVWEKVMDNSEVKEYPKDRLKEVKQGLVDLYEGYASQAQMEYEEYLETIKLTDEDLNEAAEATLKQELVANLIADKYGLKPTEEDFQTALEEYAEEYKFTNVELLLTAVSKEEMREMVIRDNVRAWLTDRCKYVDKSVATKDETKGSVK
jgi:FKBP-type peptidyl-prolyl cis-trans isomerase (trigger factor)